MVSTVFHAIKSAEINLRSYSQASATMETAAAKVFNITELLESILLNLDPCTLLLCSRVDRTWRAAAHGNIYLRRKLFLEPATLDQVKELGLVHKNTVFLLDAQRENYFVLNPVAIDYELLCAEDCGPTYLPDGLRAVLEEFRPEDKEEYTATYVLLTPRVLSTAFRHNADDAVKERAADLPGTPRKAVRSARALPQMLLTQPPMRSFEDLVKGVELHVDNALRLDTDPRVSEKNQMRHYELGDERGLPSLRASSGLTVSEVREVVRDVLARRHAMQAHEPWAHIALESFRLTDRKFEVAHRVAGIACYRDQLAGRGENVLVETLRKLAAEKYGY